MDLSPSIDTSLDKRWLSWARLGWTAILLFSLWLYAVSIPEHLQALFAGPLDFDPFLQYFSLTPQESQVLLRIGLPPSFYPYYVFAFETLWVLLFFLPALILRLRKFTDRMALYLSFTLLGYGFFATPLVYMVVLNAHPILRFFVTLIAGFSFAGILISWFLFPDGNFVPSWTRPLGLGFSLFGTLWPFIYIYFPSFPRLYLLLSGAPGFLLCIAIGLYAQAYRYSNISSPVQRQQTKWVLFGFIAMVLGMFLDLLPILVFPSLFNGPMRVWYLVFSTPVTVLSITMIPVSITFSIFRYRLWDIDLLIRRTLIYTTLSAALALVYFACIVVLQLVFRALTQQAGHSQVVIVLSTLAIAALFNPLRKKIQEGIDRRFYRRRYDAEQTLQAFAATLRDEVDLEQLSNHLLAVIQETLQPESVSLWLRRTK